MMPAIKKAFNLLGDDIVELHTEIEALRNQIVDYDQKWLEESKTNFLKQIDDEIMSRMKKQLSKRWEKEIFLYLFKYECKYMNKYTFLNTILDKYFYFFYNYTYSYTKFCILVQIILYKWHILLIISFGKMNSMGSFRKEINYKI